MEKNLDITKPRHSEQISKSLGPTLYQGSTVLYTYYVNRKFRNRTIVCYAAEVRQRLQAGNKATSQKLWFPRRHTRYSKQN